MVPLADQTFAFNLQQCNTLNVSGLAAYVQRSPSDRVGWVYARRVWLPGWSPAKWAYEVQYIEVTFESYCVLEEYQAEQLDVEPWKVLMVTAHTAFLTDELHRVEAFFAQWTDSVDFVRHPDEVSCPREYANEELSEELPARWNLIERAWVAYLLCLQQSGVVVVWSEPRQQLQGRITDVGWNSFELTTTLAVHRFRFSQRHEAQVYRVHDDGYVESVWTEPTARVAIFPEELPFWSYARNEWVMLDDLNRQRASDTVH